jgi:hypothetical protein
MIPKLKYTELLLLMQLRDEEVQRTLSGCTAFCKTIRITL